MKSDSNVLSIVPTVTIPSPPKHMKASQKAAWRDLASAAPEEAGKPENRFTLEIAATLMAKFRDGKPMTATESKQLKQALVQFGLAKADEGDGPKKLRKNAAKYFGDA